MIASHRFALPLVLAALAGCGSSSPAGTHDAGGGAAGTTTGAGGAGGTADAGAGGAAAGGAAGAAAGGAGGAAAGGAGGAAAGGTGGASGQPVDHAVFPATLEEIKASHATAIGPIPIPQGGTITYTLSDQTQTFTPDHFDVSVMLNSRVVDYTGPGSVPEFAAMTNVVNATSTTTPLQQGSYAVVVTCDNLVDACIAKISVVATY